MQIFSIILTTITSLVNAGFTIIAFSGGFAASYTNSSAGLLPRTIAPLIYSFILPVTLFFLIMSLSGKPEKSNSKVAKYLRVSFALTFIQAISSLIIYQLNYQALTTAGTFEVNIIPVIVEILIIVLTFAISIVFAIKAADSKIKFEIPAKSLAFLALFLGLVEFLLDIVPIVIFKINPTNSLTQSILQWAEYLRMLNPVIFAFAALNSFKKLDRWAVIAWLGVFLAFLARVLLYTIAYI
ncbi:hypothetical protein IJG91_00845 [Candidatus Saccharibacteria bacterium]|nr:hypothetical protein [Candidatus Saccharibacteria bacterium]